MWYDYVTADALIGYHVELYVPKGDKTIRAKWYMRYFHLLVKNIRFDYPRSHLII